jgi:hypothetical protein
LATASMGCFCLTGSDAMFPCSGCNLANAKDSEGVYKAPVAKKNDDGTVSFRIK